MRSPLPQCKMRTTTLPGHRCRHTPGRINYAARPYDQKTCSTWWVAITGCVLAMHMQHTDACYMRQARDSVAVAFSPALHMQHSVWV
jgi:hypothetical protein